MTGIFVTLREFLFLFLFFTSTHSFSSYFLHSCWKDVSRTSLRTKSICDLMVFPKQITQASAHSPCPISLCQQWSLPSTHSNLPTTTVHSFICAFKISFAFPNTFLFLHFQTKAIVEHEKKTGDQSKSVIWIENETDHIHFDLKLYLLPILYTSNPFIQLHCVQ